MNSIMVILPLLETTFLFVDFETSWRPIFQGGCSFLNLALCAHIHTNFFLQDPGPRDDELFPQSKVSSVLVKAIVLSASSYALLLMSHFFIFKFNDLFRSKNPGELDRFFRDCLPLPSPSLTRRPCDNTLLSLR